MGLRNWLLVTKTDQQRSIDGLQNPLEGELEVQ